VEPPKHGTTYAETPPIRHPGGGTERGIKAEETHEDESIVESLTDCLQHPSIDPAHPICDDRPQEQ